MNWLAQLIPNEMVLLCEPSVFGYHYHERAPDGGGSGGTGLIMPRRTCLSRSDSFHFLLPMLWYRYRIMMHNWFCISTEENLQWVCSKCLVVAGADSCSRYCQRISGGSRPLTSLCCRWWMGKGSWSAELAGFHRWGSYSCYLGWRLWTMVYW